MKFSDEQQKIIDAKCNNNLVSASAGSGKTTVLTARIGKEVVEGDLSVDSMLVVTFTEDAASNMADKIEKKIDKINTTCESYFKDGVISKDALWTCVQEQGDMEREESTYQDMYRERQDYLNTIRHHRKVY